MACGEYGPGRLPEPADILKFLEANSFAQKGELAGKHILVTAGPTHEPIDPVRVIANRSSGKQGFAIAAAAAEAGARVTLIAGPVALKTPEGASRIDVETAEQMAQAVEAALPADVAILVAAVADWRVDPSASKLKKSDGPPTLAFVPNPDILATLGNHPKRPGLVIGFAAETDDLLGNAAAKREAKGADWIVANDVSGDVMGGANNRVHLVTAEGVEDWPEASKEEVARRLIERIAQALA
jgi:phosphopantothenoylcysteine decarboxylase/phosphopantothenate--cysteine ligase